MLLGTIVIALYENHIRYATETPGSALNIPQLEIAVELCKKAATGILYLIQKLPGSAIGVRINHVTLEDLLTQSSIRPIF